ncbi:MAG: hypothetical protein J6L82_05600 [Alphaproteobacteria bacterium]|nr:hypothetical protein [Alphaproteobacteria bacterium]
MKIRRKLSGTVSAAVLTVSALICGCSTPGSSLFKTDTEQSILSWSAGNHEDAVHYAQKALQDNPNDTYAMMVAGLSYESLGYPNRARAFYEQAAASDSVAVGMFGAVRNVPAEELKKAAATRLSAMNLPQAPLAVIDPSTQTAAFTAAAFPAQVRVVTEKTASAAPQEKIKGGLDMLSEGDRNIVLRFLTFIRLRDEKYVTEEEWRTRRSVNLGGLLPYTLSPAGKGLDLPAPSGDVIVGRLNALRDALEIRAITPREHAAEREIILEALLPSNPFYRMDPVPVPRDILEGATALRRVEMLQNLKLITPAEAKKEKAAIEKLTYAKIGMTGSDGQSRPETAKCIQKCLSVPCTPCAPATKSVVKKTAVKKAAPAKKATAKPAPVKKTTSALCPC